MGQGREQARGRHQGPAAEDLLRQKARAVQRRRGREVFGPRHMRKRLDGRTPAVGEIHDRRGVSLLARVEAEKCEVQGVRLSKGGGGRQVFRGGREALRRRQGRGTDGTGEGDSALGEDGGGREAGARKAGNRDTCESELNRRTWEEREAAADMRRGIKDKYMMIM